MSKPKARVKKPLFTYLESMICVTIIIFWIVIQLGLGNTVAVFLNYNIDEKRLPTSLPNGTLDEVEELGNTLKQVHLQNDGFYVALDCKYR